MLFFIRSLVEALLLPLGISGLLMIAGIVLRNRRVALAGVIALYAFSTPVLGRMMMRSLERVYEPKAVADSPSADAIMVLNGGIVRGITASGVQWGEAANRYFAGIDLALAGKAKTIVLSAGVTPSQGAILRQTAIRQGIQPERIIVTPRVLTTEDEARAASEIPGIHSILLVTSGMHMPRAVMLFRASGLDVRPFPTDERVFEESMLTPFALVPRSDRLNDSEAAMREYYGLAVYRMVLAFRPTALRH
jgi:uncharacterized SAM-binding protein YcdF (DUF218 family)